MKTETLLELHFVALAILGGLLLSYGEGSGNLFAIAIVASLASLVLVDFLNLLSLPAWLAYVLMAVASIYCIGGFWHGAQQHQISAVARLLVLVQAILHFQRKNQRVFEQLGVFALLELIVASVLNDALVFGLLLVPFCICGLGTLLLLQTYCCEESPGFISRNRWIKPILAQEITTEYRKPIRSALWLMTPAVACFAGTFFYALPRPIDANQPGRHLGSVARTGYSDTVQFDQMGELLQSHDRVMRLDLLDKDSGQPYQLESAVYLRGQVLETYRWDQLQDVARWTTDESNGLFSNHRLPSEYVEEDANRRHGFDRINAQIRVEPLKTATIFSIVPYYESAHSHQIRHWPRRWLMRRTLDHPSRFEYEFLTHAFHQGRQTRWIRYIDLSHEPTYANRIGQIERSDLLRIQRERFPTLIGFADDVARRARLASHRASHVAIELERALARNPEFTYSLNPGIDRNPQLDPIEEFVASTKTGHCQYYAGALTLMLRSQGIPARMVVGYKTDEYNEFGKYYIARQLHAHAWVEAYFDRHDLPEGIDLFGQASGGGVWMRLDGTPAGESDEDIGRVTHAIDFAQILWDDYVLDMNNGRQEKTLQDLGQGAGQSPLYEVVLKGVQAFFNDLRGKTSHQGKSLAIDNVFSWRTMFWSVIACGLATVSIRGFRLFYAWFRSRRGATGTLISSVAFFNELSAVLAAHGVIRCVTQTADELAAEAKARLSFDADGEKALDRVVACFQQVRYGSPRTLGSTELDQIDDDLSQLQNLFKRTT